MIFDLKQYPTIGESCYVGRHASGLEVIVIPKDHISSYALLGTRYGGIDTTFRLNEEKDFTVVPDGVAHFLEHKLFENEDGTDSLNLFAALGARPNAYTSSDMTAYLFLATDKIYENLEILLKFVYSPYFTKQTVQKEIGIIGQEIRMGNDNPYRNMYYGLLEAMYEKHPVSLEVAGSEESIARITPELLYRCHAAFYHPSNMTLCVCGKFEPEKVADLCDKYLPRTEKPIIENIFPEEREDVLTKRVSQQMPVALPLFFAGLKLNVLSVPPMQAYAEHEILLDVLFGNGSDFYGKMYDAGLINDRFESGCNIGRSYRYCLWQGESRDPDAVNAEILRTIEEAKKTGIDPIAFERCKKSLYGHTVENFNSPAGIGDSFMDWHFLGGSIFTLPEAIANVTIEGVTACLNRDYHPEKMCISIGTPE